MILAKCLFTTDTMVVARCNFETGRLLRTINSLTVGTMSYTTTMPLLRLQKASYTCSYSSKALSVRLTLRSENNAGRRMPTVTHVSQHSSMCSSSEQYSFFLITRKPVLSLIACLTAGVDGDFVLKSPWILGQRPPDSNLNTRVS